jgi:hypothetical protein
MAGEEAMNEIPLQIDGKLLMILETYEPVESVVLVPGKLINVVTSKPRTGYQYRIENWVDEAGVEYRKYIDVATGNEITGEELRFLANKVP